MTHINDFVICVGTVNGSGSQSANTILLKTLFRMGIPVGGKNVFPSNIAGLPTWFWIRASAEGYLGRREKADVVIAMNPQTLVEDQSTVKPGGFFLYNSDLPIAALTANPRPDVTHLGVPFKKLVDQATDQIKIKKLLINIIYVGVIGYLLKLDKEVLTQTLKDQFGGKESVIAPNLKGLELGYEWAEQNVPADFNFPYEAQSIKQDKKYVLMDGNTAGAIGAVFGGCTVASWYPITPSSSVMENFIKYSDELRQDENGKRKTAIVQAEDEISAICMAIGAGWAGARAMTATSGPGLSLMAEAAGFSYFTEIPCVIWDVQRVGPSTGMPTRTAQGDILAGHYLSHGDTKHPLLLPANLKECFEFGQTAFDLAERMQQLVIVMSDLDLGMNLFREEMWEYHSKPYDRGKVLSADDLAKMTEFHRYAETDGDAIAPRTLPGTQSPLAAYFTRGSGHNTKAAYSEHAHEYKEIIDRLARKWITARNYVPKPIVEANGNALGIIAYGSTNVPMAEARNALAQKGIFTDYLRLRAIPFTDEVTHFIETHEKVVVIEQNRDAQMAQILRSEYPQFAEKIISICHYEGTPMTAESIFTPVVKKFGSLEVQTEVKASEGGLS